MHTQVVGNDLEIRLVRGCPVVMNLRQLGFQWSGARHCHVGPNTPTKLESLAPFREESPESSYAGVTTIALPLPSGERSPRTRGG